MVHPSFTLAARTFSLGTGSRRAALGTVLHAALGAIATGVVAAGHGDAKRKKKKPPPLRLAYRCPAPPEGQGVGTRIGQVYTATRSGTLRQIRVGIDKPAGTHGDYVVQLLAASGSPAVPDDSALGVLAAVVVPEASVSNGLTTLVANFAGTELVRGTAYAVVVGRRGGSAAVQSHLTDRCAGALIFTTGTDPFSVNNNADAAVSVLVA